MVLPRMKMSPPLVDKVVSCMKMAGLSKFNAPTVMVVPDVA